jgi:hypothetical protein
MRIATLAFAMLAFLAAPDAQARAAERGTSPMLDLPAEAALTPDALDGARARGLPDAANTVTFSGNDAAGAVSGSVGMTGSLANNSGFTTVFQNSGNNVVLQNATTVNITLR